MRGNHTLMFLSLSFSLPFSKNKLIKSKREKKKERGESLNDGNGYIAEVMPDVEYIGEVMPDVELLPVLFFSP